MEIPIEFMSLLKDEVYPIHMDEDDAYFMNIYIQSEFEGFIPRKGYKRTLSDKMSILCSKKNEERIFMENKRSYFIFDDVLRYSSLTPLFDTCVATIQDGNGRVSKTRAQAGYPSYDCFRIQGKEILVGGVLKYYLYKLGGSSFSYEQAKYFSDIMWKLCDYHHVNATLRKWVESEIRDPFFYETKDENGYSKWLLSPGEPIFHLSEDYLRFACYIAICLVKYGESYESYTANKIFGYVTSLGSGLPAKLKKNGSGEIPKEIAEYKDNIISMKANDVFATVKITLKEESENAYQIVLEFLCQLLESGFPKSYRIDFRSPEKRWLAIKGLPKKGVHQMFANAMQYNIQPCIIK